MPPPLKAFFAPTSRGVPTASSGNQTRVTLPLALYSSGSLPRPQVLGWGLSSRCSPLGAQALGLYDLGVGGHPQNGGAEGAAVLQKMVGHWFGEGELGAYRTYGGTSSRWETGLKHRRGLAGILWIWFSAA